MGILRTPPLPPRSLEIVCADRLGLIDTVSEEAERIEAAG